MTARPVWDGPDSRARERDVAGASKAAAAAVLRPSVTLVAAVAGVVAGVRLNAADRRAQRT